jgi:uncharacterized GH25 family protein
MRHSVFLSACAFIAASAAAQAHDFWLEPETYSVAPNQPVEVRFKIGHAGVHEPWSLRLDKVVDFKDCVDGVCASVADIVPDEAGRRGRARVVPKASGTHVLSFESRHSFSELEAVAFNDYAKKEGLTAVLDHRKARNSSSEPGRELYSRRAKALIRVGGVASDVSAPVGHALEIVPLANPYALEPGQALPVRVLFNGAPLRGATIDFDDLSDALDPLQSAITDSDGRAAFVIEGDGPFKLMTIWGEPLVNDRRADFETIFASLTFGL